MTDIVRAGQVMVDAIPAYAKREAERGKSCYVDDDWDETLRYASAHLDTGHGGETSRPPHGLGACDPFAGDVVDDTFVEPRAGYVREMPPVDRQPTLFGFADEIERREKARARHERTRCIFVIPYAIGCVGDPDFGRPR